MGRVLRILAATLCLAAAVPVAAEAPVDAVSARLGVTQAQFAECFRQASPSVQPERPSRRQVEAGMRALLGCLKKSNPDITAEQLEAVLQAVSGRTNLCH